MENAWTDETMEECIYNTFYDKSYIYSYRYKKDSLEIKWLKQNLKNTYHQIYIRVSGEGSKYCHNFRRPGGTRGITHKHRPIYFIIERVRIYFADIYQCCFGNDSINNRNPCNTDKSHKISEFVRLDMPWWYDNSEFEYNLFINLFDEIDYEDVYDDHMMDGGSEEKESANTSTITTTTTD